MGDQGGKRSCFVPVLQRFRLVQISTNIHLLEVFVYEIALRLEDLSMKMTPFSKVGHTFGKFVATAYFIGYFTNLFYEHCVIESLIQTYCSRYFTCGLQPTKSMDCQSPPKRFHGD